MHSKGHWGLALLLMSIIAIPFGFGPNNIIILIVLFTAFLSTIPDIDIHFEIAHRTFTHNVFFALLVAVILGILFGFIGGIELVSIGFIAGFMGIMTHLLGDLMTYKEFKPLAPFSQIQISWCWFPAESETANIGFFVIGWIAFFIYILITSEVLSSFL